MLWVQEQVLSIELVFVCIGDCLLFVSSIVVTFLRHTHKHLLV